MTDREVRRALTELQVVWLTLWGEARSESIEGIVAVASVIRNRVVRRGQSYRKVCLQPWQFSCWMERGGPANYRHVMRIARQLAEDRQVRWTRVLEECGVIAQATMRERLRDRTAGSDHYCTTRLWSTRPPRWARGQEPVATVGAHVFFTLSLIHI